MVWTTYNDDKLCYLHQISSGIDSVKYQAMFYDHLILIRPFLKVVVIEYFSWTLLLVISLNPPKNNSKKIFFFFVCVKNKF